MKHHIRRPLAITVDLVCLIALSVIWTTVAEAAPRKALDPTTTCPYARPPAYDSRPSATVEAFEAEVIRLSNLERAKYGLPQLNASATLGAAARAHSQDMLVRDFFSHTNPDGKNSADRARAAGYPSGFVGENIAAGYATPAAVVAGWMISKGHCTNLLKAEFQAIGIGYASAEDDGGSVDYTHYWTMMLGDVVDAPPAEAGSLPTQITVLHSPLRRASSQYSVNVSGHQGNWSVSSNVGWLSVRPASGDGPIAFTITIDSTPLAIGSYDGALTLTSAGAVPTQPVSNIPVHLVVSDQLSMGMLPIIVK